MVRYWTLIVVGGVKWWGKLFVGKGLGEMVNCGVFGFFGSAKGGVARTHCWASRQGHPAGRRHRIGAFDLA